MKNATCALFLAAASCWGSTIQLISGVSAGETNSLTAADVTITPHPLWYADPVAKWISFEDTGLGGIVLPDTTIAIPSARFFQDFTLAGDQLLGSLRVYADDTAAVYLDGALLFAANPTQGANCAAGPIGCLAGNGALINFTAAGGAHRLEFDVFQRSGNTFGLLYTASVSTAAVATPEASTLGMVLAALVGGFIVQWLLRRKD